MAEAIELQRKTAVLPTSRGSTFRCNGARSAWCFNIVLKSETPRADNVWIGPALIALMRMLRGPRSFARYEKKKKPPTRSQRLDWTSTDRVNANVARAEIFREITRARFQCGFGDAHHVVTSDDFLSAVISHRHDAAAFGH